VGLFSAMVFLTELGSLERFSNRRQIAAYLGLSPSSHESGECNDRKGHITGYGPFRVRKVLCQSVWCQVRYAGQEAPAYRRIVARNPKKKKIAVVACMRRLAIRMWHVGLAARPPIGDSLSQAA
jgi:transposase